MVDRDLDESKLIRFHEISSSGKTKLSHITDNVFKNALNPPTATDPTFEGISPSLKSEHKKRLPSVWRVIIKTFGLYYCMGGLHNLIYTLLLFVSPVILK